MSTSLGHFLQRPGNGDLSEKEKPIDSNLNFTNSSCLISDPLFQGCSG